jgi:hypothetical protein
LAGLTEVAEVDVFAAVFGTAVPVAFRLWCFLCETTAGFEVALAPAAGVCELANIMGMLATASPIVKKVLVIVFSSPRRAFFPLAIPYCAYRSEKRIARRG